MAIHQILSIGVGVCTIGLLVSSCAEHTSSTVQGAEKSFTNSMQLQQRAEDLRQFAEQLDQEAAGSTETVAVRKREVAKACRTRADEAERQAAQRTPSTAASAVTQVGPRRSNPQRAAVQDRFYYRRLADQLREMADRQRIEAETIAERPNRDPRLVAEKRQLAEDLAATAAEAERRAFQAEQQIPHGVVPQ
jgi:hypothetical protein